VPGRIHPAAPDPEVRTNTGSKNNGRADVSQRAASRDPQDRTCNFERTRNLLLDRLESVFGLHYAPGCPLVHRSLGPKSVVPGTDARGRRAHEGRRSLPPPSQHAGATGFVS
jgi:hypothetical protein